MWDHAAVTAYASLILSWQLAPKEASCVGL